jgi:hypothetical protein
MTQLVAFSARINRPDYATTATGRLLRRVSPADEWHEGRVTTDDLPRWLIAARGDRRLGGRHADLFTFWQGYPDTGPMLPYTYTYREVAVLPITTRAEWLARLTRTKRQALAKAATLGMQIRPAQFNEAFIAGMVALFNESPIRQGRPFAHCGKDAAQVRQEFARHLDREIIFGAYQGERLVGFVFLAIGDEIAHLEEIIATATVPARPVNVAPSAPRSMCVARQIPALLYAFGPRGTPADFKRFPFARIRCSSTMPLTWKVAAGGAAGVCTCRWGAPARLAVSVGGEPTGAMVWLSPRAVGPSSSRRLPSRRRAPQRPRRIRNQPPAAPLGPPRADAAVASFAVPCHVVVPAAVLHSSHEHVVLPPVRCAARLNTDAWSRSRRYAASAGSPSRTEVESSLMPTGMKLPCAPPAALNTCAAMPSSAKRS